MSIEKDLSTHLSKFSTTPFLFIGSGFSKRYLETESWEDLIRKFCDLVPHGFGYYRSTSNSKWDVAAHMLAGYFHARKTWDPVVSTKKPPLGGLVVFTSGSHMSEVVLFYGTRGSRACPSSVLKLIYFL